MNEDNKDNSGIPETPPRRSAALKMRTLTAANVHDAESPQINHLVYNQKLNSFCVWSHFFIAFVSLLLFLFKPTPSLCIDPPSNRTTYRCCFGGGPSNQLSRSRCRTILSRVLHPAELVFIAQPFQSDTDALAIRPGCGRGAVPPERRQRRAAPRVVVVVSHFFYAAVPPLRPLNQNVDARR